MTNFSDVGKFMKSFGQETNKELVWPDHKTRLLRVELIEEELKELKDAINIKDEVEVADALTDLLYVIYGAGHTFGINLDKTFKEVHLSNMSKLDENGQPIYRNDGKVLKGPNFFEPKLESIIKKIKK
jgi:predicted HAD superfamily Cof-like phosphohydrolase